MSLHNFPIDVSWTDRSYSLSSFKIAYEHNTGITYQYIYVEHWSIMTDCMPIYSWCHHYYSEGVVSSIIFDLSHCDFVGHVFLEVSAVIRGVCVDHYCIRFFSFFVDALNLYGFISSEFLGKGNCIFRRGMRIWVVWAFVVVNKLIIVIIVNRLMIAFGLKLYLPFRSTFYFLRLVA